ncbi:hypothetical protein BCh11DRAFT_07506 [Burkholderia sp. Ch1-1]|nr:hypothetical protein BCh11DRAFT_07506 [Burkholderia sp. Ch1-1]
MATTKEMRVDYNNKWPNRFPFPAEIDFAKRMQSVGIQQIFSPATLAYSQNYEFHILLGYLLDALDMLPMRPDLAFECLWKALDAEFFKIQAANPNSGSSRFSVFLDDVAANPNSAQAFHLLPALIPKQSCEFIAKRILEGRVNPTTHTGTLLKRVESCLGTPQYNAFCSKYDPVWASKPADAQHRAGGFVFRLMRGEKLDINGVSFLFNPAEAVGFLVKAVLPQYRNERMHGDVSLPFRTSATSLKTYSQAYFFFLCAYGLLLEVFLNNGFSVVNQTQVIACMTENAGLFETMFSEVLAQ